VTRETERLAEMAALIGQRLNSAMKDVVPPEAQTHLLNAQRELITALMLIYEHRVTDGASGRPRRKGAAPRRASPRRRPPPRAGKIPIE